MTLPPLPDLPKPAYLRRLQRPDGGYSMVPAYTPGEMCDYAKEYARAAIAAHVPEAAFGNIAAVPASLTDEQIIDLWAPMLADGVDRRPVGGRNKIVAFARAVLAAVPAQPGIRTLSSEQIERHTLTASECPPDSAVMLVSSINRLLGKSRGEGIRFAQPVAWMMTPNKQSHRLLMPSVQLEKPVVRADWELTPLYAAPQAVPVPDGMALTDDPWRKLYRRAINEANGLTNYVEDRPELRGAERRLAAIEAEARTLAQNGEKL